jgi:hypothetical protein
MTATLTAATTATPRPPALDAEPAAAPNRTARLAAGIGGVGFATVVIATNVIVGATPGWNAPVEEVTRFAADKHDQLAISAGAYAIGMPFLVAFVAGVTQRLRAAGRREDRVFADVGAIGALLLLPFFGAVVVQRIVMTVGVDEAIGRPDLLALTWRIEGAAFALNVACIGVALLGLVTAASRAGLVPAWFRFLGWTGGVASLAAAASGVAMLEGAPILPLGLVGFLTWMVTLLTIGVRQLRAAD